MPRSSRDGATLRFPGDGPPLAITVCSPRIIRVELGTTRQFWNTQLGHGPGSDMSVPLLVSNRGYAIFFDNPADGVLSVGRSDNGVRLAYHAETGPLVVYVLVGDDMRGVLREVVELLGAALMPPRWALGFLQSTRGQDDAGGTRHRRRQHTEPKQRPSGQAITLVHASASFSAAQRPRSV